MRIVQIGENKKTHSPLKPSTMGFFVLPYLNNPHYSGPIAKNEECSNRGEQKNP